MGGGQMVERLPLGLNRSDTQKAWEGGGEGDGEGEGERLQSAKKTEQNNGVSPARHIDKIYILFDLTKKTKK